MRPRRTTAMHLESRALKYRPGHAKVNVNPAALQLGPWRFAFHALPYSSTLHLPRHQHGVSTATPCCERCTYAVDDHRRAKSAWLNSRRSTSTAKVAKHPNHPNHVNVAPPVRTRSAHRTPSHPVQLNPPLPRLPYSRIPANQHLKHSRSAYEGEYDSEERTRIGFGLLARVALCCGHGGHNSARQRRNQIQRQRQRQRHMGKHRDGPMMFPRQVNARPHDRGRT